MLLFHLALSPVASALVPAPDWSAPGSSVCDGDFDGNGFDDLAISHSGAGVQVYGGGSGGLTLNPVWTDPASSPVCLVLDANGDGRDDLVLQKAREIDPGRYYWLHSLELWIGSPTGLSLAWTKEFQDGGYRYYELGHLETADFDQDGHDDLVYSYEVLDYSPNLHQFNADVLLGNGGGFESNVWWSVQTPDHPYYGKDNLTLATGDFDGNGHADLALGDWTVHSAGGGIALAFGGAGGLGTPRPALVGAPGDEIGTSLAGGGDLDGNGLADLVTNHGADAIAVIYGAASGPPSVHVQSLGQPGPFTWTSQADQDGDGDGELVVGLPSASLAGLTRNGAMGVMRGSLSGLSPPPPGTDRAQGDTSDEQCGRDPVSADFNGDGFPDWGGVCLNPTRTAIYYGP